jgi:hypothetical protein
MDTTTLVFNSAFDLWRYKQDCKLRNLEIDFDKCSLAGVFSKEDIDKAVNEFNAKIIEVHF